MIRFPTLALVLALSLSALHARADEYTNIYYSSLSVDLTAGSTTVKAADLTGFGVTSSLPLSESTAIVFDYSRLTGNVLTFASTMTGMNVILAYDIFDDLSYQNGSGSRLRAGIGYGSQKLTTKIGSTKYSDTQKGALIGANFDVAVSEDVSISASVTGQLKKFDPTFGVGVGYKVGGGKITASYSTKTDKIGAVKVTTSGFNIGYAFEY